jgi:hypothetical protein
VFGVGAGFCAKAFTPANSMIAPNVPLITPFFFIVSIDQGSFVFNRQILASSDLDL